MNHGQFFNENWAEMLAVVLLLVGFFTALVIQSPVLKYIVVFLAGLLCGRILYAKHRRQPIFPWFLVIIGFLFGFILGSFGVSRLAIVILFFIGFLLSYWAHQKGHVGYFQSSGFTK